MIPAARLLLIGQAVLASRRHWQRLEAHERRRLTEIVRNSRGRPSNVTRREREELVRLIRKLDLTTLGRDIAGLASPFGRRGRRRR
jgi:hypothetical protein